MWESPSTSRSMLREPSGSGLEGRTNTSSTWYLPGVPPGYCGPSGAPARIGTDVSRSCTPPSPERGISSETLVSLAAGDVGPGDGTVFLPWQCLYFLPLPQGHRAFCEDLVVTVGVR